MITIPTMSTDGAGHQFANEWKTCATCGKSVAHDRRTGRVARHNMKPKVLCSSFRPAGEKPDAPSDATSRSIPSNIREWVRARDRGRCVRCGDRGPGLEFHHVIEWAQGGTHDPDNIEMLCGSCHTEWTWSATITDYAAWKRTPPGRWFERMAEMATRETADGCAMLLRLRSMNVLELIDMLTATVRQRLDAP